MQKLILLLLLLTMGMLAPRESYSQTQADIDGQLLALALIESGTGRELTHDLKYAYLYESRKESFYYWLYPNWNYHIYAVCDNDCDDIDLCLFDESGNEIDCDRTADDWPMVEVSPRWKGKFRLQVKMYDCDINPCKFAVAVFGK